MHTKENDVKHNPSTSKVHDSAASPAKKMDSAGVHHAADKDKEHTTPVGHKASPDAAKETCGGIGKDGKPHHVAGCNCANKSASQPAADHAASSMGAKKDSAVPNPIPKVAAKHEAHK